MDFFEHLWRYLIQNYPEKAISRFSLVDDSILTCFNAKMWTFSLCFMVKICEEY